ncbi:YegS/Rv2252/BmrU family lipid kinase [Paenibacillus sp. JCM 10914]
MIIVNPSSGKELAQNQSLEVEELLQRKGYEVHIRNTEKEWDAALFARTTCEQQYDAVISMGGDGTLNEIVNGLAEQEHRPKLGIIPMGTVNDFARALQIPLDGKEAIQLLASGNVRDVDIGKINESYFMNIAAVGKIAEATFSVSPKAKTYLGPLAYLMEGIKTLASNNPFETRILHDQGEWQGDAILILSTLTNSVGGFEKIAPDAEIDDGQLKCIIIKDVSFIHLAKISAAVLRGEHIEDSGVEYISTRTLEITSNSKLTTNVDGDEGDPLPLYLRVLPRHLKVFTP